MIWDADTTRIVAGLIHTTDSDTERFAPRSAIQHAIARLFEDHLQAAFAWFEDQPQPFGIRACDIHPQPPDHVDTATHTTRWAWNPNTLQREAGAAQIQLRPTSDTTAGQIITVPYQNHLQGIWKTPKPITAGIDDYTADPAELHTLADSLIFEHWTYQFDGGWNPHHNAWTYTRQP